MNNIKVKGDYILLDKSNITSLENNKSYIISNDFLKEDINIIIPDNYNVKFYIVNYKNEYMNISFTQNNSSNLEFIFSATSNKKINYLINNYVKGNNNKTLIKGRIFNDKNANTLVTVNGTIDENTIGNDYTEDIRGLNIYSNNLEIKPNLIVSTNEVIANHMVTIGNFDEKQVEYLKEKGISNENIQFLLLDAFLNNIFPKDMF